VSPNKTQARRSEIVVLARMVVTASRRACGSEFSPRDDHQRLSVQHRFGQKLLELEVL